MGFDRIAPPGTRPTDVLSYLHDDLGWPTVAVTRIGEPL
jgi:hypothetical protein